MTTPSFDAEATRVPSGENTALLTHDVCAYKGPQITSPVKAFHIIILLSLDDETIYLPEGEYATELTQLLCTLRGP